MRLEGWQEKLWAVIDEGRNTPFGYPSNDCCTFSAKCVDAMTGSNIYADLSQRYSDEESAKAYIAAAGGLEAAVSEWLGPSQAPNFAGPGDVVLGEQIGLGPTLGICLGLNCAFAAAPSGLTFANRQVIQRCWKID